MDPHILARQIIAQLSEARGAERQAVLAASVQTCAIVMAACVPILNINVEPTAAIFDDLLFVLGELIKRNRKLNI